MNGSSLKNYNFDNNSKEDIILKYEEVLYSRENQVTELSMELGKVQEKLLKSEERIEYLENQLERLNNLISKKDFYLNEELKNKEVMFMRLQSKEIECDELKEKIKGLKIMDTENLSNNSILNNNNSNKLSSFTNYLFGSKSNKKHLTNNDTNSHNKLTIKSVSNNNKYINNDNISSISDLKYSDDINCTDLSDYKEDNHEIKNKGSSLSMLYNDDKENDLQNNNNDFVSNKSVKSYNLNNKNYEAIDTEKLDEKQSSSNNANNLNNSNENNVHNNDLNKDNNENNIIKEIDNTNQDIVDKSEDIDLSISEKSSKTLNRLKELKNKKNKNKKV